jgi:hypothetical protein
VSLRNHVSSFEVLRTDKQRLIPTAGCNKLACMSVARQFLPSDSHARKIIVSFKKCISRLVKDVHVFSSKRRNSERSVCLSVRLPPCLGQCNIFRRPTLKRLAEFQQFMGDVTANSCRD